MKNNNKQRLMEMMGKLNPEMKKKINESEVTREIDLDEENVIDVVFFGKCRMVDIGVGSHEFWGSKSFDSRMGAECENITWHEQKFTEAENLIIKNYLNDHYHEIKEEMEEKFEEGGGY